MLRLVERRFGEGRLDTTHAGSLTGVGYELDVYRDWVVRGSTLEPGEWVIEGHLLAAPDALAALNGVPGPYLLHLDDDSALQVFVLDGTGRIVNVEGTTFVSDPPGRP